MAFLDALLFLIKYTPFWAVPLLIISLEFGHTFWLKSIRKLAFFFGFCCFISTVAITYYYWAGGGDMGVKKMTHYLKTF